MINFSPSKAIQVTEAIDMKYVDRGDTGATDFADGAFTKDGAPHNLDLSSIVPAAGANHLVHIGIEYHNSGADPGAVMLAKPGTSGAPMAQAAGSEPVANAGMRASDLWVMMDGTRVIQYTIPTTTTIHWFYIRGYWTD